MSTLDGLVRELDRLGVELSVAGGALRYRSPGKLPPNLLAALRERRDALVGLATGEVRLKSVPMTPPQRQLWALSRLSGRGELAYLESFVVLVPSELDRGALERSVAALLDRHEVLRSEVEPDGLRQTVLPSCTPFVRELPMAEDTEVARALVLLETELEEPRGLEHAPQLRVFVARVAGGTLLALAIHHCLCDGNSFRRMARELAELYTAESGGTPVPLPPSAPFENFVRARAALRASERSRRDRDYWLERLGKLTETPSPPLRARTFAGARAILPLALTWEELTRFAAARQVTPFAVFLAICDLAVGHDEGDGRGWIAVTLDYRGMARCADVLGYCSEVYPLTIPEAGGSLADRCKSIHRALFEAFAHHSCSLADLAEERTVRSAPRFGATIAELEELAPFDGAEPRVQFVSFPYRDVALSFELFRMSRELVLTLDYCIDLVARERAEHVLASAATMLEELARS